MLSDKSLTELRALAQSLNVPDVFSLDMPHLVQAIQVKQKQAMPAPKVDLPPLPIDGRILTKAVARKTTKSQVEEYLVDYVSRGLKLSFPTEEHWELRWDKKTDTGTLRQPLRNIVMCARRIMDGK